MGLKRDNETKQYGDEVVQNVPKHIILVFEFLKFLKLENFCKWPQTTVLTHACIDMGTRDPARLKTFIVLLNFRIFESGNLVLKMELHFIIHVTK